MKVTNELKTGIVVVVAIAVAVFFWLKTASFSPSPYKVKTYFNFADGIKPDSLVKLSGIEVGRVEKIQFIYTPETKVELLLTLEKDAKVREDSLVYISTSGIVGDTYIGLTPGSPDKPFAKEGAVLASEDPVEARKIWKKAESIAENLDKTLSDVRTLAQNFTGVAQNLNSALKDNRPRIDSIAANLEQTAVNFKDFSEDIKKHPWKLLSKGKE